MQKQKTLGDLQAPFELTFAKNKRTWQNVSYQLDKLVAFLGKDRPPDLVFTSDIVDLEAWLWEHYGLKESTRKSYMQIGSQWYKWMEDMGYVEPYFDPFFRFTRVRKKPL